jgi:FkbH-like protein
VSQLIQKTNQFNLSLKRRTLPEIRALRPEFDIWVVSASDRFGDYGLVGVCFSRKEGDALYLDSLLVSCRALGRGIEEAFLCGIARKASLAGVSRLYGHYLKGSRNEPMKIFLEKNGFTVRADGAYEAVLDRVPTAPGHLQLRIE